MSDTATSNSTQISNGESKTNQTSGSSSAFLAGFANFKRENPMSDKFDVKKFHHLEFYCGDALNTYKRFMLALGMEFIAKTDLSTGNNRYCSYVLRSGDLTFSFTSAYGYCPLSEEEQAKQADETGVDKAIVSDFFAKHGLGVRSIGIEVEDAAAAFNAAVANGGQAVKAPWTMTNSDATLPGCVTLAEVKAYGDVVLQFVSKSEDYKSTFLPQYHPAPLAKGVPLDYGIRRLDHCVGNVHSLEETIKYMAGMTGFHEFAEFTAEDVGTVDSGLNSMVLASNNERVLLPVNEPTYGTPRKSQIQTYLEHNNGAGVQHLALACENIFETLKHLRAASALGGFELMDSPGDKYYDELPQRIGDSVTEEQYAKAREYGLLIDKDDQGVLLQIFTKPLGDRPTIFVEFIQRVGCMETDPETGEEYQKGGCGGFGKGNFKALFKSIEDYEKTLNIDA